MDWLASMIVSEICKSQVIIQRFIVKACECLESRRTSISLFLLFLTSFWRRLQKSGFNSVCTLPRED